MICLIFMCVYWLPIRSLRSRKVWLRGREGKKRRRRQWRSLGRQNHASGCVLAVTLRFWSSRSPTPGTWWVGHCMGLEEGVVWELYHREGLVRGWPSFVCQPYSLWLQNSCNTEGWGLTHETMVVIPAMYCIHSLPPSSVRLTILRTFFRHTAHH